jgi:hypothetical protein
MSIMMTPRRCRPTAALIGQGIAHPGSDAASS